MTTIPETTEQMAQAHDDLLKALQRLRDIPRSPEFVPRVITDLVSLLRHAQALQDCCSTHPHLLALGARETVVAGNRYACAIEALIGAAHELCASLSLLNEDPFDLDPDALDVDRLERGLSTFESHTYRMDDSVEGRIEGEQIASATGPEGWLESVAQEAQRLRLSDLATKARGQLRAIGLWAIERGAQVTRRPKDSRGPQVPTQDDNASSPDPEDLKILIELERSQLRLDVFRVISALRVATTDKIANRLGRHGELDNVRSGINKQLRQLHRLGLVQREGGGKGKKITVTVTAAGQRIATIAFPNGRRPSQQRERTVN